MTTPTLHLAEQQARRLIGWHFSSGGDRPGIAVTRTSHEHLRVVVCEPEDTRGHDRHRLLTGSAHHVAGAPHDISGAVQSLLRDDAAGCGSVTVADLDTNGTLALGGFAAPPVLCLRTTGRVDIVPQGVGETRLDRLVPGDGLVICSPTLLEDPPQILAALRRQFGHGDRTGELSVRRVIAQLMSDLERSPRSGVAVAVEVTDRPSPGGVR
ncbi:MAG: hypothetical protein QG608_1598 [Actinomycetota bacterium]|nr:hypothetical protein [Actinomycetota bacterium]